MELRSVVKLAFKHSKCNYISIHDKSSLHGLRSGHGTFRFDEDLLIESIDFLMDISYFSLGNLIYRQIMCPDRF